MTAPSSGDLAGFFRPRNVALVGASDKSGWSRMIFSRFADYGHEGEIFAVNRSGAPAHGLPGYTSVAEIPAKIDIAYIYVPAQAAAEAIRQVGAAGVRHAVVLSSGFAETGTEGVRLQAELLAAAEAAGVLMLGPNSLGFANIADRCVCTCIPTRAPVARGRLAIVSQSGALAGEFGKFAHGQGIGLSFVCATGNEAQFGIAEVLDYLVDDPSTGAIAIYVESIQNPGRFTAAADRARRVGKPIVILKVGRSAVSGAVALAHTGALVGDDRIFDAMCRRYGIVRTNSIAEMVLTANFLEKVGPIDPPRIGVASLSGGACGIYADLAEMHGLAVPPFAEATKAALRGILPDFASTLNPLDVTAQAVQDPTVWSDAIPVLVRDPGLGLIVTATPVSNNAVDLASPMSGLHAVLEGYRKAGKPPVLCNYSIQDCSQAQSDARKAIGIEIVLPDLEFGVRALAHLQRWSESILRGDPASAPGGLAEARPTGERQVLEHLAAHGAPVIPALIAHSAEEAAAAAEAIGAGVVLKILSPDIAHKTEAGGVRLDVRSAAEAARVYGEVVAAARAHSPSARIDGVIVSPMRAPGLELIVGVTRDPLWGPAIVVGLGGIFAEALRDSQVRLLPLGPAEAREMLLELRGARVLSGFRGAPPADLDELARVICAIGEAALALGPELAALEVNPLRVNGREIECLDGLAVYSNSTA